MPACTIRPIQPEDNSPLATIIRDTFVEYKASTAGTVYEDPTTDDLYRLFRQEKSVCWVAAIDENIAGCAGIYPTDGLPDGCCEFVKFYIAPPARGKGLGYQLMNRCIAHAKALNFKQVYLESLPLFSNAIRLYQKAGFRTLSAPLGNSGHYGCTIWMIIDL